MLERQYFLSSKHCLQPLTIFPMNRCSHRTFVYCWNIVFNVVGSCHHSIVPKLLFPSLIHWGFRSIPCRYAYLCPAVPLQIPPQIGVGGDLVPRSPSLFVKILCCVRDGPHSCLNIAGCVESSRLRYLRNIYTLLVFRHPIYVLSHLCTIVGCTVSKNVPSL